MSSCQKYGCLQRSYRLLLLFSIVKTSSTGFKELGLQIVIVPNIALFFFTFQSSAFWPFKRPKRRRLMTVNIKKNNRASLRFDRVDPPSRPGFSGPIFKRVFASTRTGPRPGSTRRAGPGFKTLVETDTYYVIFFIKENNYSYKLRLRDT